MVPPWLRDTPLVPDDATAELRERRRDRISTARLYFVCDAQPRGEDPGALLEAVFRGGADIVQLREKAPRCAEEVIAFSHPFRRAADAHQGLFILNDLPELVGPCEADGVHVGQDDVPVAEARAIAGPDAIVGLSTHTPEQIETACEATGDQRPDQISVGPVFETPTKEGRPATGLALIEHAAATATLPWFAIGGIDASNVAEVVSTGAERIVVVRAIRNAPDPELAARALRAALEGGGGGHD
jgi:thiamine-phosphate pyrophosphorylase